MDTGSTYTTLDSSLRGLLGEPLSLQQIGDRLGRNLSEFGTETPSGQLDLSYFKPIPIKLGDLDLADESLHAIADLQKTWVGSGVQFHGFIGASFLRRFVWDVDFDQGLIAAFPPGTTPRGFQSSVEVLMLWSPKGVPVVRAQLGNEDIAFIVDTADGSSGRIQWPIFNY